MERQEGSFRNGKGRADGGSAKGSVKMEEKEGGYSLGFKSRTRRTGLPRPRDASHFFRFLFAPGRILPFSPLPPLPLPFSRVWPFWPPPLGPSFLLPNPRRCPRQEQSESHGLRWARDSRPPRCYPKRGRKEGGRIGKWSNLANDSARFVRLMWFDWQRKYKDLFPLANICRNKIIFRSRVSLHI